MPQYARPSSDMLGSNTFFVNQVGANTSLYQSIDEVSADDADYIVSAKNPVDNVFATKLTSVSDPLVDGGHTINFRYKKDVAVNPETIDLIIQIREAYANEASPGTLIATNTYNDISSSWTTSALLLSDVEAGAITDHANLTRRVVFNKP